MYSFGARLHYASLPIASNNWSHQEIWSALGLTPILKVNKKSLPETGKDRGSRHCEMDATGLVELHLSGENDFFRHSSSAKTIYFKYILCFISYLFLPPLLSHTHTHTHSLSNCTHCYFIKLLSYLNIVAKFQTGEH